MKYRNRPKVVEAEQYRAGFPCRGVEIDERGVGAFVVTIHGQITPVAEGDFIIMEPDGIHFYPCKPDIFEQSYEAAE